LGDGKIRHVVIIVQENRTVDNLFQGLAGADTASYGLNSSVERIVLAPRPLASTQLDLNHEHKGFLTEYASGKMNGFDLEGCTGGGCMKDAAYSYVPRSQVQPYFRLAETYAFGDRMFQTNSGPSFPAHQYLIAGTSMIAPGSPWYAVGNPSSPQRGIPCSLPSTATVRLIEPLTGLENKTAYPCFDHPTLIDLLENAGLTWRYYEVGDSWKMMWDAPGAIAHIRNSPQYASNVVASPSQFLSDIQNGPLAAVTWIRPSAAASDHSGVTDGSGPAWVASVVDAIGHSSYWNWTAIFITWDDWGGWYDHVTPPRYNYYELGFRVPLIVVSPYAKRAYVSHVRHDFGSILKFAEEALGLPTLGYADARADDLSDCFDFSASPSAFQPIEGAMPQAYFRSRELSAVPPDDD
jgi:phospholipase C